MHDPVADARRGRARIRRRARRRGTQLPRRTRSSRRSRTASSATRPVDDFAGQARAGRPVRRREMPGRCRSVARARRQRLAAVMRRRHRARRAFAACARRVCGRTAALARHRQRRLHRLAPAGGAARAGPATSSASTTSRPAIARNLDEVRRPWSAQRVARHRFIEADIARRRRTAGSACDGVDIVLHQAALGSVPRSIDDPLRTHARQRDRLPEHAGRGARRGRRALRLRRIELDVRRPSGAAEGRGPHRRARCRRMR